jgi:hypothetical protein
MRKRKNALKRLADAYSAKLKAERQEAITDDDLFFGNELPSRSTIDHLANNAIDATPIGQIISFEDAYKEVG